MLVRSSRAVARAGLSSLSFAASAPPTFFSFSNAACAAVAAAAPLLLVGSDSLHSSGFPLAEQHTMAEEQAKEANDQPTVSASNTQDKGLGKLAVNIMPHILNLYNLKATAADYEMYASDATFEDPLMCAKGVKQIKSAFYSMPKVFSDGKMGEYWVQEEETSPGSGKITIDNTQQYKIWGKTIDVKSLIKLQVENGRVIRHEDLWDKHPLLSRETVRVPLVGRTVEGFRRVNLLVTHVLMGCGKDPAPKS